MCKCGCRGWCSIFPILWALRWMLLAMHRGERPHNHPDGSVWPADDPMAQLVTMHGVALSFKAMLLYVKGDWAEWAHTLAMQTSRNKWCPCPLCFGNHFSWHTGYPNMFVFGLPFGERGEDDHHAACAACEIHLHIAHEWQRADIFDVGKLTYLKGKLGRGRTLRYDVPRLGLCKGDRLEPSGTLLDVGLFDEHPLPFDVVFWRTHYIGRATSDPFVHRNPLWDPVLHTSPHRTLAIDALHALYLGPCQRLVSTIFWRVIYANPWRFRGTKKCKWNWRAGDCAAT